MRKDLPPTDLPTDVSDALLTLKIQQPEHPLVKAYAKFIEYIPTPENAEHIFYRFRPRDYAEATFEDALVELLAKIEDELTEYEPINDEQVALA